MRWDTKNGWGILRILILTAVIYLAFRYLLPLTFPFVIAFLMAILIRPVVQWLHSRLRIPNGIGAIVSLGGLLAGLVWAICSLGRVLMRQAADLVKQFPAWIDWCSGCLDRVCSNIEKKIALEPGVLVNRTRQVLSDAGERISQEGLSFAVENSATVFGWVINAGFVIVFIFMASVLFLTGEERRKAAWKHIPYREELSMLKSRLGKLGRTYVRCELFAIVLTCLICVAGLWIIGNPYALLIGIVIGILDALPLFGTGTVFIPWAIVCFVTGNIWQGVVLLLTYAAGYVMHQLLETRMLGESMGATPLMTLAALYAGMKLFGLSGLVLGPVGYILIREILGIWEDHASSAEKP